MIGIASAITLAIIVVCLLLNLYRLLVGPDTTDRALALDPRRRPSAAQLAEALRATRPRHAPKGASNRLLLAPCLARALGAGVFAGAATTLFPFWPTPLPYGLAAAAAALTFFRPRLGLALAIASAIFPLGNLSLGLAIAYGVAAAAWLALSSQRVLLVATAVALGYGVNRPPDAPVERVEDPLVAAREVALTVPHEVWRLALVAGAAVAVLRFVRTRWHVSLWGGAVIAAALLPNASVAALPVIALVWAACGGLGLKAAT
jgi:hypothetical protein